MGHTAYTHNILEFKFYVTISSTVCNSWQHANREEPAIRATFPAKSRRLHKCIVSQVHTSSVVHLELEARKAMSFHIVLFGVLLIGNYIIFKE